MTLRGIPGALGLGLLASLIAHSALYRGDHAMGGAYHGALVELAVAGVIGFVAVLGALAWSGARAIADGSVLAARLRPLVPHPGVLALATALWFGLGERIEPHHADVGLVPTLIAVALAAFAVLTVARWCVRLLAASAIAFGRSRFARRTPRWVRRAASAPIARRTPPLRRRFARPPPVCNACA